MSEEDPTKCLPSHWWSSCHPPTSDGSVCLATGMCPVCPVTLRSLSAITRMSFDEVRMKMSYQCPTSVLILSDHLPVAPITLLLVMYQHHLCVTNSDEISRKWKIRFPTSFRSATNLCGRGASITLPSTAVCIRLRHFWYQPPATTGLMDMLFRPESVKWIL